MPPPWLARPGGSGRFATDPSDRLAASRLSAVVRLSPAALTAYLVKTATAVVIVQARREAVKRIARGGRKRDARRRGICLCRATARG
jgi:hypothetical protein